MPLGACGCIRDPLYDRHRCTPHHDETSRRRDVVMAVAAVKAANHLSEHGLTPIFDAATTAAMYALVGGDT
jgi:hypothetical protein